MRESSRRTFVKGMLAGASALVLGFDPIHRSWVTFAEASVIAIPDLDGVLLTDAAALETYSDDFGKLVQHTPIAVLLPGSVSDVINAIKFCQRHNIKVVGRGQGHSSGGQSLVEGGLVIDMGVMNEILEISPTGATVSSSRSSTQSGSSNRSATFGATSSCQLRRRAAL